MIPDSLRRNGATTLTARRACRDQIVVILRSIKAGDATYCKERSAEAVASTREKLLVYDATVVAVPSPDVRRLDGWLMTMDNRGADVTSALEILLAAEPPPAPPASPWVLPSSGTFTLPASMTQSEVLAALGVGPFVRDELPALANAPPPPQPSSVPSMSLSIPVAPTSVKVFISHAKADEAIAGALIEFLESSLEMPEGSIRCTSVPGHKLATGTLTSEALRSELRSVPFVVGLVTPTSAESQWVLFELGARWGLGLRCAPLLHPSFDFNMLPAALNGAHAAKLDDEHGVVQLIDEIERDTGCRKRGTPKILAAARKLGAFATALAPSPPVPMPPPSAERVPEDYNEDDILSLIEGWMGNRPGDANTSPIIFESVDRELGLPLGSAAMFIEKAATRWDYRVFRRGKQVITFERDLAKISRWSLD
jgi:hypothetical protein